MSNPTDPLPNSLIKNFSAVEQVAYIDMIGKVMLGHITGVATPDLTTWCATLNLLRILRDDLAARNGIGVESMDRSPAFIADSEIRRMEDDGIFDCLNTEDSGA